MSELISLQNIGKELARKLASVGIKTAEELRAVGSEEAFIRMRLQYPNVCLVHLMAIEGAISDMEYNQLPEAVQQRLKAFNDGLK